MELAPHSLCLPRQRLAGDHHLLQHQRWLGGGHADSHHHVYSRGRALLHRSVKGDAHYTAFSGSVGQSRLVYAGHVTIMEASNVPRSSSEEPSLSRYNSLTAVSPLAGSQLLPGQRWQPGQGPGGVGHRGLEEPACAAGGAAGGHGRGAGRHAAEPVLSSSHLQLRRPDVGQARGTGLHQGIDEGGSELDALHHNVEQAEFKESFLLARVQF